MADKEQCDKRREDVLDVRNQMAARAIQWERQPGIHNGVMIAEELRWWIDRFDEAMPASTPSHVGEFDGNEQLHAKDVIDRLWMLAKLYARDADTPKAMREAAVLLNRVLQRASAPSTTPQKPGVWEWPINTVGRLIGNLQNMPPEMPFYTAYFVEIAGQRVTRTTHPSVSRETVAEGRVQKYDAGNESVVMWATCMPSAIACSADTARLDFLQTTVHYDEKDPEIATFDDNFWVQSHLPKAKGDLREAIDATMRAADGGKEEK